MNLTKFEQSGFILETKKGFRLAFDFAKKFKRISKIVCMHYEKTPETRGQFLQLANGVFNAE